MTVVVSSFLFVFLRFRLRLFCLIERLLEVIMCLSGSGCVSEAAGNRKKHLEFTFAIKRGLFSLVNF